MSGKAPPPPRTHASASSSMAQQRIVPAGSAAAAAAAASSAGGAAASASPLAALPPQQPQQPAASARSASTSTQMDSGVGARADEPITGERTIAPSAHVQQALQTAAGKEDVPSSSAPPSLLPASPAAAALTTGPGPLRRSSSVDAASATHCTTASGTDIAACALHAAKQTGDVSTNTHEPAYPHPHAQLFAQAHLPSAAFNCFYNAAAQCGPRQNSSAAARCVGAAPVAAEPALAPSSTSVASSSASAAAPAPAESARSAVPSSSTAARASYLSNMLLSLHSSQLLKNLQPSYLSSLAREQVFRYIQWTVNSLDPSLHLFSYGSVPLKTYLPEGDIDIGIVLHTRGAGGMSAQTFLLRLKNRVEMHAMHEEKMRQAYLAEVRAMEAQAIAAGLPPPPLPVPPPLSPYQLTHLTFINAPEVKLLKLQFNHALLIDISVNTTSALATVCWIEEMEREMAAAMATRDEEDAQARSKEAHSKQQHACDDSSSAPSPVLAADADASGFAGDAGVSTLSTRLLEGKPRSFSKHILKQSILLIKAWSTYESRTLASSHALLSTYALEILVIYVLQHFPTLCVSPLHVLYVFLSFYADHWSWDKHILTLAGPVDIEALQAERAASSAGGSTTPTAGSGLSMMARAESIGELHRALSDEARQEAAAGSASSVPSMPPPTPLLPLDLLAKLCTKYARKSNSSTATTSSSSSSNAPPSTIRGSGGGSSSATAAAAAAVPAVVPPLFEHANPLALEFDATLDARCIDVSTSTSSSTGTSTLPPLPPILSHEAIARTFSLKFFNILDPLDTANNLGKSVNYAAFCRIRACWKRGATQLREIMRCARDIGATIAHEESLQCAQHTHSHILQLLDSLNWTTEPVITPPNPPPAPAQKIAAAAVGPSAATVAFPPATSVIGVAGPDATPSASAPSSAPWSVHASLRRFWSLLHARFFLNTHRRLARRHRPDLSGLHIQPAQALEMAQDSAHGQAVQNNQQQATAGGTVHGKQQQQQQQQQQQNASQPQSKQASGSNAEHKPAGQTVQLTKTQRKQATEAKKAAAAAAAATAAANAITTSPRPSAGSAAAAFIASGSPMASPMVAPNSVAPPTASAAAPSAATATEDDESTFNEDTDAGGGGNDGSGGRRRDGSTTGRDADGSSSVSSINSRTSSPVIHAVVNLGQNATSRLAKAPSSFSTSALSASTLHDADELAHGHMHGRGSMSMANVLPGSSVSQPSSLPSSPPGTPPRARTSLPPSPTLPSAPFSTPMPLRVHQGSFSPALSGGRTEVLKYGGGLRSPFFGGTHSPTSTARPTPLLSHSFMLSPPLHALTSGGSAHPDAATAGKGLPHSRSLDMLPAAAHSLSPDFARLNETDGQGHSLMPLLTSFAAPPPPQQQQAATSLGASAASAAEPLLSIPLRPHAAALPHPGVHESSDSESERAFTSARSFPSSTPPSNRPFILSQLQEASSSAAAAAAGGAGKQITPPKAVIPPVPLGTQSSRSPRALSSALAPGLASPTTTVGSSTEASRSPGTNLTAAISAAAVPSTGTVGAAAAAPSVTLPPPALVSPIGSEAGGSLPATPGKKKKPKKKSKNKGGQQAVAEGAAEAPISAAASGPGTVSPPPVPSAVGVPAVAGGGIVAAPRKEKSLASSSTIKLDPNAPAFSVPAISSLSRAVSVEDHQQQLAVMRESGSLVDDGLDGEGEGDFVGDGTSLAGGVSADSLSPFEFDPRDEDDPLYNDLTDLQHQYNLLRYLMASIHGSNSHTHGHHQHHARSSYQQQQQHMQYMQQQEQHMYGGGGTQQNQQQQPQRFQQGGNQRNNERRERDNNHTNPPSRAQPAGTSDVVQPQTPASQQPQPQQQPPPPQTPQQQQTRKGKGANAGNNALRRGEQAQQPLQQQQLQPQQPSPASDPVSQRSSNPTLSQQQARSQPLDAAGVAGGAIAAGESRRRNPHSRQTSQRTSPLLVQSQTPPPFSNPHSPLLLSAPNSKIASRSSSPPHGHAHGPMQMHHHYQQQQLLHGHMSLPPPVQVTMQLPLHPNHAVHVAHHAHVQAQTQAQAVATTAVAALAQQNVASGGASGPTTAAHKPTPMLSIPPPTGAGKKGKKQQQQQQQQQQKQQMQHAMQHMHPPAPVPIVPPPPHGHVYPLPLPLPQPPQPLSHGGSPLYPPPLVPPPAVPAVHLRPAVVPDGADGDDDMTPLPSPMPPNNNQTGQQQQQQQQAHYTMAMPFGAPYMHLQQQQQHQQQQQQQRPQHGQSHPSPVVPQLHPSSLSPPPSALSAPPLSVHNLPHSMLLMPSHALHLQQQMQAHAQAQAQAQAGFTPFQQALMQAQTTAARAGNAAQQPQQQQQQQQSAPFLPQQHMPHSHAQQPHQSQLQQQHLFNQYQAHAAAAAAAANGMVSPHAMFLQPYPPLPVPVMTPQTRQGQQPQAQQPPPPQAVTHPPVPVPVPSVPAPLVSAAPPPAPAPLSYAQRLAAQVGTSGASASSSARSSPHPSPVRPGSTAAGHAGQRATPPRAELTSRNTKTMGKTPRDIFNARGTAGLSAATSPACDSASVACRSPSSTAEPPSSVPPAPAAPADGGWETAEYGRKKKDGAPTAANSSSNNHKPMALHASAARGERGSSGGAVGRAAGSASATHFYSQQQQQSQPHPPSAGRQTPTLGQAHASHALSQQPQAPQAHYPQHQSAAASRNWRQTNPRDGSSSGAPSVRSASPLPASAAVASSASASASSVSSAASGPTPTPVHAAGAAPGVWRQGAGQIKQALKQTGPA